MSFKPIPLKWLPLAFLTILALTPALSNSLGLALPPPLTDLSQANLPPWCRSNHLLGTDGLGRDVLSALTYGAMVSLSVSLAAAFLATTTGLLWGTASAMAGKKMDLLLMGIIDTALSIPSIVLLLSLNSLLQALIQNENSNLNIFFSQLLFCKSYTPGLLPYLTVILAISLTNWLEPARLCRARVLILKTEDYFEAAQALGANQFQLLIRHILPNLAPLYFLELSLVLADALIMESGLSFLGLGLNSSTPSWGTFLQDAQYSLLAGNVWAALLPASLITVTTLAIYQASRSNPKLIT